MPWPNFTPPPFPMRCAAINSWRRKAWFLNIIGAASPSWPGTRKALQLAERQGLQTHYRRPVNGLNADGSGGWGVRFADGLEARHATVVLANGQGMSALAPTTLLPLYAVRGQVSHIPATAPLAALRQVLCFDGYLTPQSPGNACHCLGTSYQRGDAGTDYRESEQQQNLQRLRDCLPEAPWLDAVDISGQQARCGGNRGGPDIRRALAGQPHRGTGLESQPFLDTQLIEGERDRPAAAFLPARRGLISG